MSTPRHRENVDRPKAEAALLLPGDPPEPDRAAKLGRRSRARSFHRGIAIDEVADFVRTLGDVWSTAQIAAAIEQHFDRPVRK